MRSEFPRAFTALFLALLTVLFAGCVPAELSDGASPTADTAWAGPALAYDAATGTWSEAVPDGGDELLHEGVLYRVTEDGLVDRGPAELLDLLLADQPYEAGWSEDRLPFDDEWVYVLGDGPAAGHQRFAEVRGGERFAFLGRVFATRVTPDGAFQVRTTGEVISEVTATFERHAPVLLDLTLELEDGSTSTLSVTEGHPFYVPAEDTYRPVRQLPVGTVLRVAGGGEAVLAAVERREGDFEVFNVEVAGQHNYFAGDAGVAVHNAKCSPKKGIYEFPDKTAGGKPYVGQSGNISKRLKRHKRAGRLEPGTEKTTDVVGGKTQREIAEHKRIQEKTGGVPARKSKDVSNKIDPIGRRRQHLLGEK